MHRLASPKLTSFYVNGKSRLVNFVETQTVKDGVECDIYTFADDTSKDLAIVKVRKGYKTPLQRVLKGEKTIEGFMDGSGTFTIQSISGDIKTYEFKSNEALKEIIVKVGEIMQWRASGGDLTFYEICEPPYEDGRFENISE